MKSYRKELWFDFPFQRRFIYTAPAAKQTSRDIRRGALLARVVAVLLLLALVSPAALGDGIAFKGRDFSSLLPAAENEQFAAIHHRDGVQHMIIAINFDAGEDDKGLWIFPVPGSPDRVKVDIQDKFPRFSGYDPRAQAGRRIRGLMTATRAWQIYPLVFEVLSLMPTLGRRGGLSLHEEIEKWGIHVETVTADSLAALAEHLRQRATAISPELLQTLEPYLNSEYVLVVAWISSLQELRAEFPDFDDYWHPGQERSPCLYVEFPTERAFYPLRPTRAYGEEYVGLRLYVIGYVEVQTAPEISAGLRPRYYCQDTRLPPGLGAFTTGLPEVDVPYTHYRASFAAKEFTEDLWFERARPAGMRYAGLVNTLTSRRIIGFLLAVGIALLSYTSGGISGLIVLKRWRRPAQLGTWNLLTLVGLAFALRHDKLVPEAEMPPGVTEKRMRLRYLTVFSLTFVASTIILQYLLTFWLASA